MKTRRAKKWSGKVYKRSGRETGGGAGWIPSRPGHRLRGGERALEGGRAGVKGGKIWLGTAYKEKLTVRLRR